MHRSHVIKNQKKKKKKKTKKKKKKKKKKPTTTTNNNNKTKTYVLCSPDIYMIVDLIYIKSRNVDSAKHRSIIS